MKKLHFLLLLGLFSLLSIATQAQTAKPTVKAKFGKGISLMAQDSSMYIKASFRTQSLFETSGNLEPNADWESSFLVRRARLKFDGWVLNPNLSYKTELALSNKDLKSTSDAAQTGHAPKIILDAVVKWKFHKNLTLWAGQTKLPGNRERVVSSQKLQLVDRSLVNSIFNIDRDMGLQLRGKFKYGNGVLKPMFSISMGEGRNVILKNIGGYNYTGRLEYLPMGEFASKGDYFGADLKREPTPKLAFGATYNVNQGASRQKQSGVFLVDEDGNYFENNLQTIFVDMMFKYRGFSLMAEYADKRCILDKGVLHEEVADQMVDANGKSYYTGHGVNVQAGYLFKGNWEVAARYTTIMSDWEMSFTDTKEYTLGLSKYIVGHNLKVQSDVSIVDKASSDVNKLRYRLQFELAF